MEHDVSFPQTTPLAEIPRPAFRYGADGTVKEVNVLVEGLADRPLIGMTIERVIERFKVRGRHGTGLPLKESPVRSALDGTEVLDLPLIITTATGSDVHILATASPIREGEKITGARCVWRDVSEIEFEVRSRGKFRIKFQDLMNLIEVIPLPIRVALNPEGSVITGNAEAHRIYGTKPGDNFSASQSPLQFLDKDGTKAKPGELPLQRAAAEMIPIENVEMEVVLLDGKRICQVGSTVPFSDLDGRVIGSLGGFIDITDRKHLEKERQLALDATRMGLWRYGLDSDEITVDDRFKKIFKVEVKEDVLPKAEILDRLLRRPQSRLPDGSTGTETVHVSDSRQQDPLDYPITLDGSSAWIELHWISYAEDTGSGETTSNLVGTVRDISHKKEKDAKIEQYTKNLEGRNDELDRFAYTTSHDLQEPLRSIVSYSKMLERRYKGQLGADADEFIEFIVEGGRRMQDLIKDLLAYSRAATAQPPVKPVEAEVALGEAVAWLDGAIRETDAEVTHDPLPAVFADPTQLQQIFANLVGNAIKYRRQNCSPRVHVSARRDGSIAEFSVADNGIGIEAEYFDQIFQIYKRLHTHEEYEGTGIGLALVKRSVEQYGGTVRVESIPGEGSTFFFTLPAA